MKQSCGPAGPSLQLKPQPWFSGHVIGAEAPLPVPSGLSQNPSGVNGPLALCPLELLAYHLRQLPLGWVCCPGCTGEPVWASCSGQSWLAQGPGLWSSLHLPTGGLDICLMPWASVCMFSMGNMRSRASLLAQMVKNLPAVQETQVQSLGWEDPLEKGMATHSSIFAWRNSWTEEPGRLQSMGSQRAGHNWSTNAMRSNYIVSYKALLHS